MRHNRKSIVFVRVCWRTKRTVNMSVVTDNNLTLTELLYSRGKVGFGSSTDIQLTVRDPREAWISSNV